MGSPLSKVYRIRFISNRSLSVKTSYDSNPKATGQAAKPILLPQWLSTA
ncbi:MAG: hypothetical protein ACK5Y2_03360 [Bdellovibrionales bacterium]